MNRYEPKRKYKVYLDAETYKRVEAYTKEQGIDVRAVVMAAVADIGVKP